MKKDLKYYLSLNYPVEMIQIPADEGGGFSVCIPQLGRSAFIADGETLVFLPNGTSANVVAHVKIKDWPALVSGQ